MQEQEYTFFSRAQKNLLIGALVGMIALGALALIIEPAYQKKIRTARLRSAVFAYSQAPKGTTTDRQAALRDLTAVIQSSRNSGIRASSARADEVDCIMAILEYEMLRMEADHRRARCSLQGPGTADLACLGYEDTPIYASLDLQRMLSFCGINTF